jgi:hypothetical protein
MSQMTVSQILSRLPAPLADGVLVYLRRLEERIATLSMHGVSIRFCHLDTVSPLGCKESFRVALTPKGPSQKHPGSAPPASDYARNGQSIPVEPTDEQHTRWGIS